MRILAGKPVAEIFRGSRAEHRVGVRENPLEGYAITKIGLSPPRPALYARIDARVKEMLAAGWLDEVRALVSSEVREGVREGARESSGVPENARGISAGVRENAKPFQFIGYSDLLAHVEGRISLADAVAKIQQSTRRFAKRQLTWFRREPDVHWLEAFGDDAETITAALDRITARSPS